MRPGTLLRVVAVAMACAAWLDPGIAAPRTPRVAVFEAAPTAEATRMTAWVAEALDPSVEVVRRRDPLADAWVVVAADRREADVPPVPAHVALSLVTAPAAALRLDRLHAPRRVAPGQRAALDAVFVASGLQERRSLLQLRAGGLVLAQKEHTWTQARERLALRFETVLPRNGTNQLTVTALDEAGTTLARGDVLVTTDVQPLPVLVFEARPSWAASFVRRALARDPRFAVTLGARVSRRLVASAIPAEGATKRAPAIHRLTPGALHPFALVIVGGLDALEPADVQALRAYVERRGGAVALVPDCRTPSRALALLPGLTVQERLLDEPVPIEPSTMPGVRLRASELLEPRGDAPDGVDSLVRAPAAGPGARWLLLARAGRGRVLWVGALDAWRYRSRDGHGFDRFWTQSAEWLARGTPEPLALSLDAAVVRPGEPVVLRARTLADAAAPVAMRASLAPEAAPEDGRFVRLWPDDSVGGYRATINAPDRPGVYAVTVHATGKAAERTTEQIRLVVDRNARTAHPPDDRWQAASRARHGVVATVEALDGLTRTMGAMQPRETARRLWHPLRSAWWILPFAACLGADWWLRRRRGER